MAVKNNQRADRGANRKVGNAPEMEAREKRKELAKQLGLKPKTVEFIHLLEENPKLSQTEAYMMVHKTNSRKTASVKASELVAKGTVQIYKDSAIKKAKKRIVELVQSNNESIAIKASQDIIDRTEGKAQQKDGAVSRSVKVTLDLTGVKLGNHYLPGATIDGNE